MGSHHKMKQESLKLYKGSDHSHMRLKRLFASMLHFDYMCHLVCWHGNRGDIGANTQGQSVIDVLGLRCF